MGALGAAVLTKMRGIDGRRHTVRMHRFLLGAAGDLDIDHINRNRLDNRRANLRHCTRGENLLNRGPRRRWPRSGVPNVRWDPSQSRWAAFTYDGERWTRHGSYLTVEEAVVAQQEASARPTTSTVGGPAPVGA